MRHSFTTQSKKGGYSLLELVVYVALFAVISVVLVRSLLTVMKTYARAQAYRQLQNNGELVMERIIREVRDAESITGGTYNSSPGAITLTNAQINTTVGFTVADRAVVVTTEGVPAVLSSENVRVDSLVFRVLTTPYGTGVKTELLLSTSGNPSVSAAFYSTTLLRQ